MTHGSLFSGIGGFDLAAQWAGWENLFYCEINKFCRQVLQYHFPKSISYEDIKQTDFKQWRGKVDVISGGFPCQPFSLAGQRKGADDDRYLWPEMLRAIREIQPTWVVGENVAGILTMVQPGTETSLGCEQSLFGEEDRERILVEQEYVVETVCGDLEREGYSVQPFVIPACAVGAPHRRDRVWFVARLITNTTSCRNNRASNEASFKIKRQKGNKTEQSFIRGSIWTSSDTDGNRSTSRKNSRGIEGSGRRNFSQQEERRNTSEWNSGLSGFLRDATNSERERSRQIHKNIQSKKSNGESSYCNGGKRDATNSTIKGFQGTMPSNSKLPSEYFANFPTVSPVCGRDDGIPFDVDSLTIPFTRWRQEAVKAYGNAIVPQVAYEIFKAINELND